MSCYRLVTRGSRFDRVPGRTYQDRPTAQWYRNVVAEPRVLVRTGARPPARALARPLPPDGAARLLDEHAARSSSSPSPLAATPDRAADHFP
ncbi:nitroreductase/quinone reductase family protein [Cellulosimicrobium marinum]|nr:nitroreductase/quinone reductase family protein [Cellulosimicrobium marinum]